MLPQVTFPTVRLRRLRQHPQLRALVRETSLSVNDLVFPLFIRHGEGENQAIESMPGQYQITLNNLTNEIKTIQQLKIPAVILFGIPSHKDPVGSDSYADNGIMQQAIQHIKEIAPELLIISDICFCGYTDHGHCGVLNEQQDINNDKTLELLVRQSISHARTGTNVIAPSGMIDGMVTAIRHGLDGAGYKHIPILSYSTKFCSKLYGPFGKAAEDAPQFGDRATCQIDPANTNEALRETAIDIAEGADMLMVKPALFYLDIIQRIRSTYPEMPLAAYQVSGEYSMIKAASKNGWLNEQKIVLESLTAIKRAGANFIITYFAKDAATWLKTT